MNLNFIDTYRDKLELLLGEHKNKHSETLFRVCPYCGNHKFNFQVNFEKRVFNCWVCNKGGSLFTLLRKMGIEVKTDNTYASSKPIEKIQDKAVEAQKKYDIKLPEGYKFKMSDYSMSYFTADSWEYKAYSYLYGRKLSDDDIKRYDVWYWNKRVLFPFYDMGYLVFWTARSIDPKSKLKYLHAECSKDRLIIRYQGLTDEIYVVEGVFDAVELNRSGKTVVMVLGSLITQRHVEYFRTLKKKIVLCLDSDMSKKQHNLFLDLQKVLGFDKVESFFLWDKDIADCGFSESVGGKGTLGYVSKIIKDGVRFYEATSIRKVR